MGVKVLTIDFTNKKVDIDADDMFVSASNLKFEELVQYCLDKTGGGTGDTKWYDEQIWKLYRHLLEQARRYQSDDSGFACNELLEDQARAKARNAENQQQKQKMVKAALQEPAALPSPSRGKEYYTSQEAADMAGIKPSTVRKYGSILQVEYMGSSYGKHYRWTDEDIIRLKSAVSAPKPRKKDTSRKINYESI